MASPRGVGHLCCVNVTGWKRTWAGGRAIVVDQHLAGNQGIFGGKEKLSGWAGKKTAAYLAGVGRGDINSSASARLGCCARAL